MKKFDFEEHLADQKQWSEATFGPTNPEFTGEGNIDHIRRELNEIEQDPFDIYEWIDVVILALDGAWRAGHSPKDIVDALVAKHEKNKNRKWPDWRTATPGKAIEHLDE